MGKKNKCHQNWKGRNKLSLFPDDMIVHREISKNSIEKNWKDKFRKVGGHKINTHTHTQNQLHFSTLTKKCPKRKFKKLYHLQQHQKVENTEEKLN